MNLEQILNWRYSTKNFDPSKKISESDFNQLKNLLRMSPSSTNLQPWHFIIAQTEEGKKRVAKGTEGFFHFNANKIMNASHVVVFCSKIGTDQEYMQRILQQESQDGRYPNPEVKESMNNSRNLFASIHQNDIKDMPHWLEKQVYLNLGSFLLGTASLGIDAVPMEGIDMKAIDQEFGLTEKGFTAITVVGLGYRAENDFNDPKVTPKSRLPESEIMSIF